MKERPILFSAPMVRAILDGRKTQTRRAIKPARGDDRVVVTDGKVWKAARVDYAGYRECPYGQPGDRLWVRETFVGPLVDHEDAFRSEPSKYKNPAHCLYRADGATCPEFINADDELVSRWKPSIHMPRWASRITLEVTGVRVERLQAISEADAVAEGVRNSLYLQGGRFARENYAHLWWVINGDGAWELNPWVWVVEFRRVEA
jgi:hypothetical protein